MIGLGSIHGQASEAGAFFAREARRGFGAGSAVGSAVALASGGNAGGWSGASGGIAILGSASEVDFRARDRRPGSGGAISGATPAAGAAVAGAAMLVGSGASAVGGSDAAAMAGSGASEGAGGGSGSVSLTRRSGSRSRSRPRIDAPGPGSGRAAGSRWPRASKRRIEPATAALSEPIAPRIGIRTNRSQRRRTDGLRPWPSLPTTMTAGLDELEKDGILLDSLGELLARCYLGIRRSEDEAFRAQDEEFELRNHFYRF